MNERLSTQPGKKIPSQDYIAAERQGSVRHEYINGNVVTKTGGNRWHNLIATSTAIAIGTRLQGNKAEVYINGMRVQLNSRVICYPDVVIVNGEPTYADAHQDLLMNPTVIMEVFSPATNPNDKSKKLECYLALESIRECLQIKADEMRVEHFFSKIRNSGSIAFTTSATMSFRSNHSTSNCRSARSTRWLNFAMLS